MFSLGFFTISQTLANARVMPQRYAYTAIICSMLSMLFGVLFAYLGYGVVGVLFGITLGTAISSLITFNSVWSNQYDKSDFNKNLFDKLLKFGIPIALATGIEEIIFLADRSMIALLQGASQTGFYAVSYDLSQSSILMIMTAISLAAYPMITKLEEQRNTTDSKLYIRNYFVLLLGISIPALVGINLVGEDLIELIIDKKYHTSMIEILPWITTATFLLGIQFFYLNLAFQLSHKTIISLKVTVVVLIVNLLSNYVFILSWGIKGAAIATLLSFAVGNILSIFLGRKHYSLPFPIPEILKIIISSFIMALVIFILKNNLEIHNVFLQIVAGVICYFIAAYLFNVHDLKSKIRIKRSL